MILVFEFRDVQVSDDEVTFLTRGDAEKDDVVLSLMHDKLKLLIVTDGEKGCRYYTKVRDQIRHDCVCFGVI